MCKASQHFASVYYKLDLVYVKSPVISRLPCHIFMCAPLIQSFKTEIYISNLCQDWTSLMNQLLLQEERIRAMCWFCKAAKSSAVMILQCLPHPPLNSPKLAGSGRSRALCYLEMLISH